MRVGQGYDVHKLIEGRKLILGGVDIPFEKGLLGHSDADVLVHAIMDAILGACGLGDIGIHFPDTEDEFKDADSIKLLTRVNELILSKGYVLNNIDSTIIAERPKLKDYIPTMKERISKALDICIEDINIKATTEEGLGFTGSGEGIAASAICLVESIYDHSIEVTRDCGGCNGCQKA